MPCVSAPRRRRSARGARSGRQRGSSGGAHATGCDAHRALRRSPAAERIIRAKITAAARDRAAPGRAGPAPEKLPSVDHEGRHAEPRCVPRRRRSRCGRSRSRRFPCTRARLASSARRSAPRGSTRACPPTRSRRPPPKRAAAIRVRTPWIPRLGGGLASPRNAGSIPRRRASLPRRGPRPNRRARSVIQTERFFVLTEYASSGATTPRRRSRHERTVRGRGAVSIRGEHARDGERAGWSWYALVNHVRGLGRVRNIRQ